MSDHIVVTETTRKLATVFYGHVKAGNLAGIMNCLDEHVELHEPGCLPYGGIYRGHEGLQKFFSLAPQYLDIASFVVEAIVVDGDRAVGILQINSRATGQTVDGAEELIVRDGKIVRIRVFVFNPTLINP